VNSVRINHQADHHSCTNGNPIGPIGEKHVNCSNLVGDSEGYDYEGELAPSVEIGRTKATGSNGTERRE
jgi:hypothetical protein